VRSKSVMAALAVFLLVACRTTPTSGTLAGTIRDNASTVLAGAVVTTTPASSVDTTDAAGHFRMDYLPVGTYQVMTTCAGHVPVTQQAEVKAGETTHVDMILTASLRTVSAEMVASDCHMGIHNRMAMYALMDSIGERVSHVEYHATSDSMGESWEAFLSPAGEQRRLFYNPSFGMGGWLYPDGAVELRSSADFRRVIDSMMAIPSPVQIGLSGTSDGQAVDITVQLTGVDDIGVDSKLAMGIVENGPINFVNVMGGDTTYVRDVALNMTFTDTLTLAPGETRMFTAHLVIPDTLSPLAPPYHVVNKSDIGIFAVVQDMTTKQVHQSAKKKL
jgi:hypothetical protein